MLTVALLGMTGCAGPVAVTEPTPAAADQAVCAALLADLPDRVLDERRRETTPGGSTAAWGNPPITLRCGVTKPPGLGPASACYEVNGVGWFAEEATGGYLFTTIGRPVFVEVAVPGAYAPEATALTDLADVVTAHVPLESPCQ